MACPHSQLDDCTLCSPTLDADSLGNSVRLTHTQVSLANALAAAQRGDEALAELELTALEKGTLERALPRRGAPDVGRGPAGDRALLGRIEKLTKCSTLPGPMALVIPRNELNEFSLPRVCVTTGQPGAVTFQKVQLQYTPRWVRFFIIAPLLYVIFHFVLRKTASGTLPFSEQGWSEVKAARRNVGLAGAGVMGVLALESVVREQWPAAGPAVFVVGMLGGLGGIVLAIRRFRNVYPVATLIDDTNVTLKLPSAQAEQLISQHLSAGARRAP